MEHLLRGVLGGWGEGNGWWERKDGEGAGGAGPAGPWSLWRERGAAEPSVRRSTPPPRGASHTTPVSLQKPLRLPSGNGGSAGGGRAQSARDSPRAPTWPPSGLHARSPAHPPHPELAPGQPGMSSLLVASSGPSPCPSGQHAATPQLFNALGHCRGVTRGVGTPVLALSSPRFARHVGARRPCTMHGLSLPHLPSAARVCLCLRVPCVCLAALRHGTFRPDGW